MVTNNDFKTFQKEVSWFLKPTSNIRTKESDIRLSIEFKETYPKLTLLIEKARVTSVDIDQVEYLLFAWDSKADLICGWLNKIDEPESCFAELMPEHELIIRFIGGMRETFNNPETSFADNQNFMFSGTECSRGIGDWDQYYHMACEEENYTPIDFNNFIVFAKEANGALTMYNPDNKTVLLFSHDHCFDNVNFMDNQPQYTFHSFKGVDTFIDYVEELATQWLKAIK
jgi:hypothetical protein